MTDLYFDNMLNLILEKACTHNYEIYKNQLAAKLAFSTLETIRFHFKGI